MESEDALERVTSRRMIFRGKYLHLEMLHVKLKDGRRGEREIVRVPDAVAVLPVEEDGTVHLVRQHRPAIGRTLLEIPAGLLDVGEDEEGAALRECEEETGYVPGRLERILSYAHAEGYSTGFITLFLGTDLSYTGNQQFDSSEYVEPVRMPYEALLRRVKNGEFVDSKTILCAILCEKRLARTID